MLIHGRYLWGRRLLAFLSLVMWAPAVDHDIEHPALRWALRLGFPAVTIAAAIASNRAKPPERLAGMLRTIQANRDGTCPRCGTTLTVASPWYRCGTCGLERQAVPAP